MTSRLTMMCLLALLAPAASVAQPAPARVDRLTLADAVRIAVAHNRAIQSARLDVESAEDAVASARTRRLPIFQTEVRGSQLVTPVDFAFPRGAFGDFPGTGSIPAADTRVSVSRQPTLYVSSEMSQPLSQLAAIGLGIRKAETGRDLARERGRAQELAVVSAVTRLYYAILQIRSALAADEEAIALYRELARTLQVRAAQQVVLRSDALDVGVRLAQAELSRTVRQNALASRNEELNQLLGREIGAAFEVDPAADVALVDVDLRAAQARALDARPDVRQARLTLRQAELNRRIAQAGRIPDVSLAASYISNFNVDMLPRNLASIGVQVQWEPFDWGRRGRELATRARAVQQAQISVREAEDRTLVEVNSRFRALAEKRALLAVAQMTQASAREKVRVASNQFKVQSVLLPDVLRVRAELAESDDRYQQALLAFWTAKADFEYAIGEDVIA